MAHRQMSEHNPKSIEGVIPAIVTPLTEDGGIDSDALANLTKHLWESGVSGILANGTTGEGAYLSTAEQKLVLEVVGAGRKEEQLLLAACLRPHTSQVIENCRAIADLRPDFLLIPPPFYHPADQRTILRHYMDIADTTTIPIIIYNIPQHTHNAISFETLKQLSEDDRFRGIKDSSGEFNKFARGLVSDFGPHFAWVQSDDRLMAPALSFGARAVVTGLGNVDIEPYLQMLSPTETSRQDLHESHRRIDRLFGIIRAANFRVLEAIKFAMSLQGQCRPHTKLKHQELSRDEQDQVKRVMDELSLLSVS